MLAAAPDRNSALGLVQVALSSVVQHPEVDISDSLKGHIVGVLQAASAIASNPSSINRDTPSEALELALRIRGQDDLSQQVAKIGSFDNIEVETAKRILTSLRLHAAIVCVVRA